MDSTKNGKKEVDQKPEQGPTVKVDALGRKVWDRNYFTDKAMSKSAGGDVVEETISTLYQGTFRKPVIEVPEVREDLKPRAESLDFSKFVGRSEVVDAAGPKSKQGGFFCKTCNCLLKDSQTYLDHLNGKKHNRLLGMTMRVQKVDAKTVAAKLRSLANRDTQAIKTKQELETAARERIKELEMYEREMRERRRMMRKEKKRRRSGTDEGSSSAEGVKEEDAVKRVKAEPHANGLVKSEPRYPGVPGEVRVKREDEEETEEFDEELEAMRASGLPVNFV